MFDFDFFQTFISYTASSWFKILLIFPVFSNFLSVIASPVSRCISGRSEHILLVILIINNWLIWLEVFSNTRINSLSSYLIIGGCLYFNHVFNFTRVIPATLSILIFLTAFSNSHFVWRNAILSALRLPGRWCFRSVTTGNNTHTIFLQILF